MTKICHITTVHSRYDTRIFYKECSTLAKAGFDTTLLVSDIKQDEVLFDVKIKSIGDKPLSRVQRILKSSSKVFDEAVRINAEIYHLHDPELLPIGLKLKKTGKSVIFDSHEDIPSDIMDKQWIPKPLRSMISRVYSLYEKRVLKRLDAIVSVTPHLTKRLQSINENTIEITNYPILREIQQARNKEKAICFAGNIKREYNHHLILEALDQLGGIKYILAGQGDPAYIEELKQMKGWKYVEYLGLIPVNNVYDIYSRSCAGISVHQYSNNVGGKEGSLGIIKNYEFLMSGIPIITTDFSIWEDIIQRYECGICISPQDVNAIASAIRFLIENPDTAQSMGYKGRKAVEEEYNWGTQEVKLIKMYEDIIKQRGRDSY